MWRNVVVLAVLAALVAGCGDDEPAASPDDDAPPPEQSARDLWGQSFTSTTVTEGGEPRPLVADTRVTLTFEKREDEDVIRFRAGCNIFGARVEVAADRLVVGRFEGTDVGCRDALERQDDWLLNFFGSDPRWRVTNDRLTLSSGETVVETKERNRRAAG